MNKKIFPVAVLFMFLISCGFTIAYAENVNTTGTEGTVITARNKNTKCTDSDGTNYFLKGLVKDAGHPGVFQNYDRCISETKLLEYTCKNDAWHATYYECPKGCAEGVCLGEESDKKEESITGEPALADGTLIRLPDDPKVYAIRNGERVWIQTAEQFKALGYKWQDIKVVSSEKMQAYKEKIREKAAIIKSKQDRRVYRLENGKLIWVPSVAAFNAQGLKWEEITEVDTDINEQYKEARLIQDEEGNIYYITSSGRKIMITSREALDSYNEENAEDIVAVSDEVADSIEDVQLIKEETDDKVYEIQNGKKRWINSIKAFNERGHKWEDVETVNEATLKSYEETDPIA